MIRAFCLFTCRWLYWLNFENSTLEVAAVTGEGREILATGQVYVYSFFQRCVWSLTVNYAEHVLYWFNSCFSQMESVNMNGSQYARSNLSRYSTYDSYGIANLNDTIFWTQDRSVYSTDKLPGEPVVRITMTSRSEGRTTGIKVIHPLQQPTGAHFS